MLKILFTTMHKVAILFYIIYKSVEWHICRPGQIIKHVLSLEGISKMFCLGIALTGILYGWMVFSFPWRSVLCIHTVQSIWWKLLPGEMPGHLCEFIFGRQSQTNNFHVMHIKFVLTFLSYQHFLACHLTVKLLEGLRNLICMCGIKISLFINLCTWHMPLCRLS